MNISNAHGLTITTNEVDIELPKVVYSFIFPNGKRYIWSYKQLDKQQLNEYRRA